MNKKIFLNIIILASFTMIVKSGFKINKPLDAYFQERHNRPIISLGTEHWTPEKWYQVVIHQKESGIEFDFAMNDLERHGLPWYRTSHQDSYVINEDPKSNPDLVGDINNHDVQQYLRENGQGKFYLIWEENMPYSELAQNTKMLVSLVYHLLRDGGHFAFRTFFDFSEEGEPQSEEEQKRREERKLLGEQFINELKAAFGEQNIRKYAFDAGAYTAKRKLMQDRLVYPNVNGEGWVYSQIVFPYTAKTVTFRLHEGRTYHDLPEDLKNEIMEGELKFDENTGEVYEEVTISSIDRLIRFDKRTKEIAEIDPVLALYPEEIIVVQKNQQKD